MTTDPNLVTQIDWDWNRIHIRQSALSTFVKCRRQYYWEYGQGIEVDYPLTTRPWSNADIGSAFHLGLERYYLGGEDWRQAAADYAAEHELGPNSKGKEFDEALVNVMLAGHIEDLADSGADLGETVKEIERQGEATISNVNGWDVTVHYKVDRVLIDRDGFIVIDDIKSVDRFMPIDNYLPQLVRYALLYRQENGVAADRVRTTQVRRVKRTGEGPFFERSYVPLTDEMYRNAAINLRAQLTDLVKAIETDGPWYENRTGECSWRCRVEDVCKAQVRGDDVGQLVELHYRKKGA